MLRRETRIKWEQKQKKVRGDSSQECRGGERRGEEKGVRGRPKR